MRRSFVTFCARMTSVPLVKGLLAYVAVAVVGVFAVFGVLVALDGRDVDVAMIISALGTLVAFVAVGRRTFGRPYLRKQTVIAATLAPVLTALAILALLHGLELAGADCPGGGMDYISGCNDLAGVSMMLFFGGAYIVGLTVVVAVAVFLAAGVKWVRHARVTRADPYRS
jgi:hypothetical protein